VNGGVVTLWGVDTHTSEQARLRHPD
jgi:hypothetical protein